ncbi:NAD(+) diphosphatase [Nocardia farcinica]|uniref:NAD(+) diphosphatase n=1 Tax=Nocardia farcinica (strain IFM 10152) TaxID=247156 RepID=Q5YR05_NOCFA|nr:NAD(+) diphosphatase [Nocardia farcinica]BAD59386.1 putative MutT family protein [Nocardia farcinica IFM 10152]
MSFQLNGVPVLSRFAGDRAETLRSDERALKEGWAEALLLRVDKRGRVRFADGALVLDPAVEFAAEPHPAAVFLGVTEGRHLWAVRTEELSGPLTDLRVAALELDDFTAGVLATALALLNWHDKAAYSAHDGTVTTVSRGGWSRLTEAGQEEFPRIDPAVICLIHDGGDRVLLGRQAVWPAGMFSLLAGFVEVGESLERCVEREVREEVGIDVRDIHYLGSQPWPFPRSLMLGFAAVGDPEQELVFSDGEIAEAHWFTRAEVREALELGDWSAKREGARLLLPGSISIARTIVESWAALD